MRVISIKLLAVIFTITLSLSHKITVENNKNDSREKIKSDVIGIVEEMKRTSKEDMSERKATIEKLFQIGLLDERSNNTLQDNLNKLEEEGNPIKKITYDSNVYSSTEVRNKMKLYNMSKIFEEGSQKDPSSRIIILKNETTLFVIHKFNKYYYWEYGQTAAAIIIFTMIVVGNISILHRLKSCKRRRSNVNYFIVHLAIADLFVGLFSVTFDTVLRFQKAFTYGLLACRASKYIQVLFIYSSTYLLVALSIDRWEAVVKPLAFTQNRNRGHYLVAGAWFLAFISATPVTLSVTIKEIENFPQCWITYDILGWKIYMVYLTSSLLVIPALIITICYTHIVYTIWQKRSQKQHGDGVIPKARIKTIKMTLVIVAAFVLCWSPFCTINLCSVFGLIKADSNWSIALMTLSQSLAHLNSAVNPIIFWLFSSRRNNSTSTTSSADTRTGNKKETSPKKKQNQNYSCSIKETL